MSDYQGKVIVITGAANGIGRELVRQFAAKGAKLSLADIDAENLASLVKELQGSGTQVISDTFDVRQYGAFEAFARKTFAQYGTVDYFFNNAGVITGGNVWKSPVADFEWLVGVNYLGQLHGIKAFVPAMIEQDKECHIINTCSIASLVTPKDSPAYVASKFAALGITEVLELQLQEAGAKVKAYAVCPGIVKTDLPNCIRHRNQLAYNPNDPYYSSEDYRRRDAVVNGSMDALGIPVEDAVKTIINDMEHDVFYIFTHPQYKALVDMRTKGIMAGIRPVVAKA